MKCLLNESNFPLFLDYQKIPNDIADDIAEQWACANNDEIFEHIGEGEFGHAYQITRSRVLKITTSLAEAAFANDVCLEPTDGYVSVYSVNKINQTLFVIVMDLVNIDDDLKILGEELDEFILENEIDYKECPSKHEHLLSSDSVKQLYWDLHYIATNNANFPMLDVHFENYGYDFDTGDVILFDQMYEKFSEAKYLSLIEQINI